MSRLVGVVAITVGVLGSVVATGFAGGGSVAIKRSFAVGPTRLLSPAFGYTVAYRTVERGDTARTKIGLFVYDEGRWRNVTPKGLTADTIDDVAFVDRRHGWVAAYNCAEAAVYLYRTSDGGRSWRSLGRPVTHSCGGGPTFLSFIDARRGWMEPVSPNGPGGELLRTDDGGRTWTRLGSGLGSPSLPCLAPVAFVSRAAGWMARCGPDVFASDDGGRHWRRVAIRVPYPRDARSYDLPRFVGRMGVVAVTLGRAASTAVAFSVSDNRGRSWSLRSVRRIDRCALRPNRSPWPAFWPASVASPRVWWVVTGRRKPVVQVTTDAGRRWQTLSAHGLPPGACAVTRVSGADDRVAWVVARYGSESQTGSGSQTALFETRDAGRAWRRVTFLK
jgi:photosystem II stability/assembly factor-like uncharacterized protein